MIKYVLKEVFKNIKKLKRIKGEKMRDIEKYYNSTESERPRKCMKYFIDKIKCNPGNAIDLGCGAGNDSVYLIKNKWNVLAVDREDVEDRIVNRLNDDDIKRFRFKRQSFEEVELEKNDLIVANYSLPFCNKDKFGELWNKIKGSILDNGYFVGNFFGVNDSWSVTKPQMLFLSKEQVIELFDGFEIVFFEEIEKDSLTALGKLKHLHFFNVIARKQMIN